MSVSTKAKIMIVVSVGINIESVLQKCPIRIFCYMCGLFQFQCIV